MYYSQKIIYNKFKEKNNENKRLLSAAGSNTFLLRLRSE